MASPDYRSRLIAARERLGFSRREMAKRLLTPRATYEQWEDGKRRTPGVAIVAAERVARVPARTIGPRARRILEFIDGNSTYDEIAKRAGVSPSRVRNVVAIAKSHGLPATVQRKAYPRGLAPGNLKYGDDLIARAVSLVADGHSTYAAAQILTGEKRPSSSLRARIGKAVQSRNELSP